MSSDIINNQVMKDSRVSGAQTTAPVTSLLGSGENKRQDVAAVKGTNLPPEVKESQEAAKEVTTEKAKEVVEQLNKHAQAVNRDLLFSVDEESGKTVIKVVNADTAELVRQIPSEEVLRLSETIRESIETSTGVIVQTTA